jgi:hypothetical protein
MMASEEGLRSLESVSYLLVSILSFCSIFISKQETSSLNIGNDSLDKYPWIFSYLTRLSVYLLQMKEILNRLKIN